MGDVIDIDDERGGCKILCGCSIEIALKALAWQREGHGFWGTESSLFQDGRILCSYMKKCMDRFGRGSFESLDHEQCNINHRLREIRMR